MPVIGAHGSERGGHLGGRSRKSRCTGEHGPRRTFGIFAGAERTEMNQPGSLTRTGQGIEGRDTGDEEHESPRKDRAVELGNEDKRNGLQRGSTP